MKISIIEPAGELYGSELCLLDILQGLDPTLYDVEVVIPRGRPFAKRLEEAGILCYSWLTPMGHQRAKFCKVADYLKLAHHWRSHRPDLIYINQGGILLPIAKIARWLKLPVVCQVQTLEDARRVSHIPEAHEPVRAFICNSEYVGEQVKVDQQKKCVVYYGYRSKGLSEHRLKSRVGDELVLGIVGRMSDSKGHYILVDALAQWSDPPSNIRLKIIGDNLDKAERGRFVRYLAEKMGKISYELTGYMSDLKEVYHSLDILLVPSLREPFGRVFCEGAEAGLPLVVSDGGGLGELSRRFDVGLRFATGDPYDLLEKIKEAVINYEMLKKQAERKGQEFLRRLDYSVYLKMIESILISSSKEQSLSVCWLGIKAGG